MRIINSINYARTTRIIKRVAFAPKKLQLNAGILTNHRLNSHGYNIALNTLQLLVWPALWSRINSEKE